jgi:hypothetical protein
MLGFVPGFGAIADVVNAGISAARGDYIGAGFSLAAAVPFIGDFAAAGKAIRSVTQVSRVSHSAAPVISAARVERAVATGGASSALQGARLGGQAPDFIVSPGGTVFTVPKGASGPFPVRTGKGFEYTGGSGGNGLSQRTTDVRIMDPVTSGKYQYPGGYGSYGNTSGQAVNPYTGKTIPRSDPMWHIPAN